MTKLAFYAGEYTFLVTQVTCTGRELVLLLLMSQELGEPQVEGAMGMYTYQY